LFRLLVNVVKAQKWACFETDNAYQSRSRFNFTKVFAADSFGKLQKKRSITIACRRYLLSMVNSGQFSRAKPAIENQLTNEHKEY
jgi:hypothetical protein